MPCKTKKGKALMKGKKDGKGGPGMPMLGAPSGMPSPGGSPMPPMGPKPSLPMGKPPAEGVGPVISDLKAAMESMPPAEKIALGNMTVNAAIAKYGAGGGAPAGGAPAPMAPKPLMM